MAGYVKIWTTLANKGEFLSLPAFSRGLYLQLLFWCKVFEDSGILRGKNWESLGKILGCEGETLRKNLGKLREKSFLIYTENADKSIEVTIPNYLYWQQIDIKQVVEKSRTFRRKILPKMPTRPDQSRAEQINPPTPPQLSSTESDDGGAVSKQEEPPKRRVRVKKETEPRIRKFIDWWATEYFGSFGQKYVVAGAKDAMAIKRLLGAVDSVRLWQVAAWFIKSKGNGFVGGLGRQIATFASQYNAISEAYDRDVYRTPLTAKQEQRHYNDKRREERSSEPTPIGSLLEEDGMTFREYAESKESGA